MKQMTRKQMEVRIDHPGDRLGNVGAALQAALEKSREREARAEIEDVIGDYFAFEVAAKGPEECAAEAKQAEYDLHELACNIAEDFDGGAIFAWRLDEVKACLRAGGTTALDEEGEIYLVNAKGDRWGTKYLSAGYEPTDGLKARRKGLGMPSVVDDPYAHLCPGCAAAERDGIATTCGGQC